MEKLIPILILTFSLTITFTTAAKPQKPTLKISTNPTDAGKDIKLTCEKQTGDTNAAKYKFVEGASTQVGTTGAPTTHTLTNVKVASPAKAYKCFALDTGDTESDPSDAVTLTVTAIPAPTIVSTDAKDGYVGSSGNSIPLTCTKGTTANGDATLWKFFKGSDEIKTGVSGNKVTVAVAAADNGKKLKCQHFNTADAKEYSSNTLTIYTDKPGKPTISGCTDVKVDKKLSLTCMKTGSVFVSTFEWYIGTKKQTTTTNEFKKDKAATGDAGEYYCKAVNNVGGTDSDKIKVEISAGTQELVSLFTLVVGVLLNAILRD